jgi:hypothetical protein
MKINLHIDSRGYKNKPSGAEVGIVSNRVTQAVMEVTAPELARVMASGYTAVLATMNGKRKISNMIQQQVLMVDFDNKDEATKKKTEGMFYTSIEDIMADSYIQKNASFLYKTFSHSEGWDKFRVVFILDKPLTSIEEVYGAYDYLFEKYPNADVACKDPSRLFFGGHEYIEIDFVNVLPADSLPKVVIEKKSYDIAVPKVSGVEKARKAVPAVEQGERPTYRLMQQGDADTVKARLQVYGCKLPSKTMAVNYFKTLNMAEVFGVRYDPFYDFFHYEENPSASIFQLEGTEVYLYKCHSTSQKSSPMDIIKVTAKLLETSYTQALNYMIDVCGIEIEVTEQIQELRDQCDLFMNMLLSEELKTTFPAIHERFWRYKRDIVAILTIFKENIYEDEVGGLRSLTWMSVRNLAVKVYGTEKKKDSVSRLLNLMTYTNWIDKLDENQIPADLLVKIKATQASLNRERRSNVFELLTLGDDFFEVLNDQCAEMKDNGFTVRGFSQEYVARTDGMDVANQVFVQDKDKTPSKSADKIVSYIHKTVLEAIEANGYVEVNEVLDKTAKKFKSKGYTEKKYKQAVSEMIMAYGLEKTRLTKELKEQFNITNLAKNASPTILIKAV